MSPRRSSDTSSLPPNHAAAPRLIISRHGQATRLVGLVIGMLVYHNLHHPLVHRIEMSHVPMTTGTSGTDIISQGIGTSNDNDKAHHHHHRPRTLFLGIFTDPNRDAMLRNVIRTTYLSKQFQPYGAPRICSMSSSNGGMENCQVIYAFLAEWNDRAEKMMYGSEADMIVFPQNNNNNSNDDTPNRLRRFHQYLQLQDSNHTWDFVAYTHCRVVLYPDRVWPPTLFHDDVDDAKDSSRLYARPYLYSGIIPVSHPTRSHIQDYVVLTIQLWHRVVNHPLVHSNVPVDKTDALLGSIVNSLMDIIPVTTIPLLESAQVCNVSYYDHFTFIKEWDDYKDTQMGVTYVDPMEEATVRANAPLVPLTKCRHGPRMLLGIMTMNDNYKEGRRRVMIRETYLSYYREQAGISVAEDERHRICSLHDFLSKSQYPEDDSDARQQHHAMLLRECQLAYVFVVGGNPTGPKERVHYNSSEPMTLPSNESDVVVLNIQENMKEGKTQSYFKYATTIIDEHVYFDYIAKTDSDTLIFPGQILNDSVNNLPAFPHNVRVYGGYRPVARKDYDHIKGPIYWQGSFYFLSVDMARYITSVDCDRQTLAVWSEDKSMCNFVHSHPKPIHRIKLSLAGKPVDHPLKEISRYMPRWQAYLQVAKDKQDQIIRAAS